MVFKAPINPLTFKKVMAKKANPAQTAKMGCSLLNKILAQRSQKSQL